MAKERKSGRKGAARAAVQAKASAMRPTNLSADEAALVDELDAARASSDRWVPEVVGDTVIGTVTKVETVKAPVKGNKNRKVKQFTLQRGQEVTAVRCTAQLERLTESLGVKVGDTVGIQYKGDINVGQASDMKTFAIRIIRAKGVAKVKAKQ